MNFFHQLEVSILLWLNSWVGWRDWVDWTIIFRVEILPYFFITGILLFAIIYRNEEQKIQNRLMILEAFVAGLISRFIIAEIIRLFYNRPRPFEIVDGLNQLLQHAPAYSFPSGHATFYFALAITVFLYYKKTGALFIFVALQLTLTRIAVEFHWPSDILAGAIIAIATAVLIHYYEKYIPPAVKEKIINFCKN